MHLVPQRRQLLHHCEPRGARPDHGDLLLRYRRLAEAARAVAGNRHGDRLSEAIGARGVAVG